VFEPSPTIVTLHSFLITPDLYFRFPTKRADQVFRKRIREREVVDACFGDTRHLAQ
jgi:hypothetical protein